MMKHILSIGTALLQSRLSSELYGHRNRRKNRLTFSKVCCKFIRSSTIDTTSTDSAMVRSALCLAQTENWREIKPGSLIRVRGKLGSKFFGDPNDKLAAVIPTWVIYLNVNHLEVLREPSRNARSHPHPLTEPFRHAMDLTQAVAAQ